MRNSIIKRLLLSLLIPAAITLNYAAYLYPSFTEKIYASGVYLFLGQPLSTVTGFFPFSLAELLVIGLFVYLIGICLLSLWQLITSYSTAKFVIINRITNLIAFCSIGYFIFITVWGLNYNRLPFAEIAELKVEKASVEDLAALCKGLVIEANNLRASVEEDSQGNMLIEKGYKDVFKRAEKGFDEAAKQYKVLGGSYGTPKRVILSEGLSYSGISGIYFPFTGEANVNVSIPDIMLPNTTAHEMAHQRGFSREDEANYIAYLTCSLHPDIDFNYSGVMLALIHSTNALYSYNKDLYKEVTALYSDALLRDLKALNSYWKKYEGPVEEIQSKINNAYLKANMQKDGIYSYGRMVDLLIAEYKQKQVSQKD